MGTVTLSPEVFKRVQSMAVPLVDDAQLLAVAHELVLGDDALRLSLAASTYSHISRGGNTYGDRLRDMLN